MRRLELHVIIIFLWITGNCPEGGLHKHRHQHFKRQLAVEGANVNQLWDRNIPEVLVAQGGSAKLPCDLPELGGALEWLRDGKILEETVDNTGGASDLLTQEERKALNIPETNGRYRWEESSRHLYIKNVKWEDNGVWQCQKKEIKSDSHTSKPIRLVVTVPPSYPYLVYETRKLPPSTRLTIKEKSMMELHCIIERSNPEPTSIWWSVGPDNLTNVTSSSNLRNTGDYESKSVVVFMVSKKHHNKSVKCSVQHPALASPRVSSLMLNVQYSPSFDISRVPGFGYPLREGLSVSMKCSVDANPPSRPMWIKKDDGNPILEQSGDGWLNFTYINRNHSGWYQCVSIWEGFRYESYGFYLNIHYETAIKDEPSKTVEAKLGDPLRLRCGGEVVPGKPPPVCWSRVDEQGRMNPVTPKGELMLNNVGYMDAGRYRCSSIKERHDVDIVVSGRPVVEPINSTLMAMTRQPSSLSVHFCANPFPRQMFWVTRSSMVRPGQSTRYYDAVNLTNSDAPSCYYAVLNIVSVQSSDAGEYMFVVKNSKGIDEATVWLNVTLAEEYSIGGSSTSFSAPLLLYLITTLVLY